MQDMYYSQYNMYGEGWLPPPYAHQLPPTQYQYFSCMEEQRKAWSLYQQSQVFPPSPSTSATEPWTDHSTSMPPRHDSPPDQILLRVSPSPKPTRSPYEWMAKSSNEIQPNQGKTRTKENYRVVYSVRQRLELEKEFRFSRYLTTRRKAELASELNLSTRQIKIWFQNRRAKDRKIMKGQTAIKEEPTFEVTENASLFIS